MTPFTFDPFFTSKSVSMKMVKEMVPPEPSHLKTFDPTRFLALLFLVIFLALLFLVILFFSIPGTPIADFLDEHEEELRRRMEETQVLITAATADMSSANLTMEEKFSKVWEKFKVENKSIETLEKEIEEVRSAARDNEEEKEVPKLRIPVYHLTQEEAADYFQELLSFIQRNILKVKRTEFRNY